MAKIPYRARATEDFKAGDLFSLLPQDFSDKNARVEATKFDPEKNLIPHGTVLFDAAKGEDIIFFADPIIIDVPNSALPDKPYYLKAGE